MPNPTGDDTLPLSATLYADPLCCWSWAFEAPWRRLTYECRATMERRVALGGMIPDWQRFSDPLNAIHRPAQMGAHWFAVGEQTGVPIAARLWLDDPPESSYPPSIAVKAAAEQGQAAGERYLRRLREAALLDGRNISRHETLQAVAAALAEEETGDRRFDAARFQTALDGADALDAFRADVQDARLRDIGRFPTVIFRRTGGPAVIVVGYRPYAALRAALGRIAPDLPPERPVGDLAAYVAYWGGVTLQEAAVALEADEATARRDLDALVQRGDLAAATLGPALLYRPARRGPALADG